MSIFLTSLSTFPLIFRPFPAPHGFPVSACLTGILAVSHPSVVSQLITDRVTGIAPSGDRTRDAKRASHACLMALERPDGRRSVFTAAHFVPFCGQTRINVNTLTAGG